MKHRSVKPRMSFDEPTSLEAVDAAFGPSSDLYKDVLRVKSNASPEQIQRAYFDRRNELLHLLEKVKDKREKLLAEKKMDAVVSAMKILGDPELRLQYDDLRSERLQTRVSPPRGQQNVERLLPKVVPPKAKARVVTPDNTRHHKKDEDMNTDSTLDSTLEGDTTTLDQTTLDYTDEGTMLSDDLSYVSEITMVKKKGFLQRVKDEVMGAIEDTSQSFSQVCNVFTLQEDDILAVTGRIDKARRQMQRTI